MKDTTQKTTPISKQEDLSAADKWHDITIQPINKQMTYMLQEGKEHFALWVLRSLDDTFFADLWGACRYFARKLTHLWLQLVKIGRYNGIWKKGGLFKKLKQKI